MKKKIFASVLLLIFLFVALTPVALAVQSDPATVQIIIDLTKPVIDIQNVTDGQTYYTAKTPTVNVTDNGSGLNGLPTITLTQGGNPVAWASGQVINQPGSYVLSVSATDNAGNQNSQSVSFSLNMPGTPTLAVTATSPTALHLSWNNVSGADNGYEVYRDGGGTPVYSGAGTACDDTALGINTQHSYVVKAVGALGSTPSNQVTLYTLANPPTNTNVSGLGDNTATISWNANGNPSGTQYSISGAGITTQTTVQTTLSLNALATNTPYGLSLVAINGDGVETSAVPIGFTTEYVPPTLITDKAQYTLGDTMSITVIDQSKAGTGSVQVQLTGIGVAVKAVTCTEGQLGTFNGTQAFSWAYNPQSGGVAVAYGQLANNITYISVLPTVQTDKNGYNYGDTATITLTDPGKAGAGSVDVSVQGILKNTTVSCSEGTPGNFTGTLAFNSNFNPMSGGLIITYNYQNNGQAAHVQLNDYYITQQAPSTPATPVQPLTYTMSVNPPFANLNTGGIVNLAATKSGNDGSSTDVTQTASWTSSNPSAATVSGGTVTAVAPGQTTITASAGGVTANATVMVTNQTTTKYSLSMSKVLANINIGEIDSFRVTKTGSDGSNVDVTQTATWSSDTLSVVTVADGVVTGVNTGQAVITATMEGMKAQAVVIVNSAPNTAYLKIIQPNVNLPLKGSASLTVLQFNNDGSITDATSMCNLNSSDTSIAQISNNVVTAVSAGNATITANKDSMMAKSMINVKSLSATPYNLSLLKVFSNIKVGDTVSFSATETNQDGKNVDVTQAASWSTDDPAVATVAGGVVTGVKEGTVTVTSSIDGLTAYAVVIVENKTSVSYTVNVMPSTISLQVSDKANLTATLKGSDSTNMDVTSSATWSSSNTAVTTVENGVVTAAGSGQATVTVIYNGLSCQATVTVQANDSGGGSSGGGSTGSGTTTAGGAVQITGTTATVTTGTGSGTVTIPPNITTITTGDQGVTISTGQIQIVTPGNTTININQITVPSNNINGQVITAVDYKCTKPTKLYFPTDDVNNSGVYFMGSNGQWTFVPSIYDPEKNMLYVEVSQDGKYALIKSSPVSFSDMSSDQWAAQAAAWLVQRGVMDSPKNDFNPTAQISGTDFAKIVARALGGYQGVLQASDNTITGADAVQIVRQALSSSGVADKGYIDNAKVNEWANTSVSTQLSRADAAVAIYWLLHTSMQTINS